MEPRDPEPHGTERDTEHGERPTEHDTEHGTEHDSEHDSEHGASPAERDSEETKVLGIDQSAATAPPTAAPLETSPPETSHVPENDPDWRPGLLPRDWEGRTAPRPEPASPSASFASSASPSSGSAATASKPYGSTARSRRGDTARRHGFDPMAMVAGTIFMAIAVMYMLDAGDAVDARPGLILALAVIGVGASGFVGAIWAMLSGRRNRRAANTGAAPAASPATPPTAAAGGAAGGPVDFTKGG